VAVGFSTGEATAVLPPLGEGSVPSAPRSSGVGLAASRGTSNQGTPVVAAAMDTTPSPDPGEWNPFYSESELLTGDQGGQGGAAGPMPAQAPVSPQWAMARVAPPGGPLGFAAPSGPGFPVPWHPGPLPLTQKGQLSAHMSAAQPSHLGQPSSTQDGVDAAMEE